MADIVLGIGTSHTPLLSLPARLWPTYAQGDQNIQELSFPPSGNVLPFEEGLKQQPEEVKAKFQGSEPFEEWSNRCTRALDVLQRTLKDAHPDITVIISDDQDEWLFEDNMPMFSVYWGDTVPLIPRGNVSASGRTPNELSSAIAKGYGDVAMDVPVASQFGRYVIEYLVEHDFDIGHMTHTRPSYGGRVARRYPTPDGELKMERTTPEHEQGLPHGYAFVVKRLFDNQPGAILPVIQNTCYPPNQPSSRRSFNLGRTIAQAVKEWDSEAKVAFVASGGLSHFVVDEEFDRKLIGALENKDVNTLTTLPRNRLYSATSESLNWVAVGGAMQDTGLNFNLVDYVPVYRTPAGTGGGWTFGRWL